jgi:hypothetical protein
LGTAARVDHYHYSRSSQGTGLECPIAITLLWVYVDSSRHTLTALVAHVWCHSQQWCSSKTGRSLCTVLGCSCTHCNAVVDRWWHNNAPETYMRHKLRILSYICVWNYTVKKLSPHKCQILAGCYRVKILSLCHAFLR